jgi:hypothetical protein
VFLLVLFAAPAPVHARSILLSNANPSASATVSSRSSSLDGAFGNTDSLVGEGDDGLVDVLPGLQRQATRANAAAPPRSMSAASVALNHVNGAATESLMHTYYSEQGWKPVKRLGAQGIDGLFYRVEKNGRLNVLIAESKTGTSRLGNTLTKGYQMSHEWILKSLDEQIAKYEKLLLKCPPADRPGNEEQLKLLRKIRTYVIHRVYRSELFHATVNNGELIVTFSQLEKTAGSEKPGISKQQTRPIKLYDPKSLDKGDLKWYNDYFRHKKQELLKKMNENAARKVIQDLKQEYINNPKMGLREERRFLEARLYEYQERRIATAVARQGRRLAMWLPRTYQPRAMKAVKAFGKSIGKGYVVTEKLASKSLVVLDVGTNAYFTFNDYGRMRSGEIGSEYFGFKAGLRTTQSALTIYALAAPDVTLTTKVVTGAAAVVLLAVDVVSDPFYEAYQARTREVLSQIDQTTSQCICREQLKKMAAEVVHAT